MGDMPCTFIVHVY